MPRLKFLFIVLLVIPAGWLAASDSSDVVDEFRTALFDWAIKDLHTVHAKGLLESGLDSSDVSEILD